MKTIMNNDASQLRFFIKLLAMCLISIAALSIIAGTAILSLLAGAIIALNTEHSQRNGWIAGAVIFLLLWGILWAASYLKKDENKK